MKGSVRIPNNVISSACLRGAELKIYAVIRAMCFAAGGKYISISQKAIGEHTGLSVVTVRKSLRTLKEKRLIYQCATFASDKRYSDRYCIKGSHDLKQGYIILDLEYVKSFAPDKLTVYAHLLYHSNSGGKSYASERKLSAECGISRSTLRKYTAELADDKILEKNTRYYKKTRQTRAKRSFEYIINAMQKKACRACKRIVKSIRTRLWELKDRILASVSSFIKAPCRLLKSIFKKKAMPLRAPP